MPRAKEMRQKKKKNDTVLTEFVPFLIIASWSELLYHFFFFCLISLALGIYQFVPFKIYK